MTTEQTMAELRERAFQEILDLFEGDRFAAGRWLSSPIHALGNHPPVSLMGTEQGIRKIRNLVRK